MECDRLRNGLHGVEGGLHLVVDELGVHQEDRSGVLVAADGKRFDGSVFEHRHNGQVEHAVGGALGQAIYGYILGRTLEQLVVLRLAFVLVKDWCVLHVENIGANVVVHGGVAPANQLQFAVFVRGGLVGELDGLDGGSKGHLLFKDDEGDKLRLEDVLDGHHLATTGPGNTSNAHLDLTGYEAARGNKKEEEE